MPKPVVDYSRVPKIATAAQIRSAARYLVRKRHCDGDLIPAIEYAIARWGCPAPQPVADGEVGEASRLRDIARAVPFEDWDFNIAQIIARGLDGLPDNDGSQDWMQNAVGICLGAIYAAALPTTTKTTDG